METFPTVKDHLDDDQVIESLMATTGGVPLQVRKLLSYQDDQQGAEVLNFEPYVRDVNLSVQVSLNALNDQMKRAEYIEQVTKNAFCCLLQIPLGKKPVYYDRNYSVLSQDVLSNDLYLKPLFPLVSVAYREYFWEALMKDLKEDEQSYLKICSPNKPGITNDTLERIFEHLVMARCINGNLALCSTTTNQGIAKHEFPGLDRCDLVERFPGQKLPPDLSKDGIYVPMMYMHFPAIDLIWKMGQTIWFVQVHVAADHTTNVRADLEKLLNDSEWTKFAKHAFLLYLSPAQSVSNRLSSDLFHLDGSSPLTAVLAAPCTHFQCMKDLQWPHKSGGTVAGPARRSAKSKPDEANTKHKSKRTYSSQNESHRPHRRQGKKMLG